MTNTCEFMNDDGTFELTAPHKTNALYFPLMNEAGMFSALTPLLHGDIKTGQHTFLTAPVSVEDLHNTRSARNFWLSFAKSEAWSATGNAAPQIAKNFLADEEETVTLNAGFLWHKVTRINQKRGIKAEITNFIPHSADQVELMRVRLTNISDHPLCFTPTAAIPIYGRSADNLRDHRHVTSLLHRISCSQYGVTVCPTLSFDERGHQPNHTRYHILGVESDSTPPIGFFPLLEDFIGEGGSLDWPAAVVKPMDCCAQAGDNFEGFEAIGGLRFNNIQLSPGDSRSYILILGIQTDESPSTNLVMTYGSQQKFDQWLQQTRNYWQETLGKLSFHTGDETFNQWLKWVSIQPVLRRRLGNSFLPYHDYGKGGRGWRDLWQDVLGLLIMENRQVGHLLLDYFSGVRMDGSNATIIGNLPGEFKADRNNIPRVWMDHGAWPLLTTALYIDQTGDLDFLLKDQAYFKDQLANRAQAIDKQWNPSQGTRQRIVSGEEYQGTVLEHLLVQHLTAFFNVGEHNIIRLEGADWNDGMDMASQRGESVAFTALYAGNLHKIGQLIDELHQQGTQEVCLADELLLLLDTLNEKVNYHAVEEKQCRLDAYFSKIQHTLSGKKTAVLLSDLAADVYTKAEWLKDHLRKQEWIISQQGQQWFNGYYDNDGCRLEGDHPNGLRMTLTGQVFPLMSGVATHAQAEEMIQSIECCLFDEKAGGYRLNTNFNEVLMNMGRCFGFAFGHKENGAVFCHMDVMYAYALYERGFAQQGFKVLNSLFQHSKNFPISCSYPGLPEYFGSRGRGVYPYLTGSASWYLLTLLTKAFGVYGHLGDLIIQPKLVKQQFDEEGNACVRMWFAERSLEITYRNPQLLEYGEYKIETVSINELNTCSEPFAQGIKIPRSAIENFAPGVLHRVNVHLGSKAA